MCYNEIDMPSWNIHLEAGNRLADKLNFSPKERKEFLLGCILPDVNNGHLYNKAVFKDHDYTHYISDVKNPLDFYTKNQDKIDQRVPIHLGYLLHLFLDNYFNQDFYQHTVQDSQYSHLPRPKQRDLKHRDFWLYDAKFHHSIGLDQSEANQLASLANSIPPIDITAENLVEIEKLLTNNELGHSRKGENYLIYTEAKLDHLLESAIEDFEKQYLGESYA